MKVGFIGLGIMGAPMAANLIKAGHQLKLYNRTSEKARPLVAAGAELVDSPAAAAEDVDVLVSILAAPDAVRTVMFADSGPLSVLPSGAIWMDCTTVDPAFAREISTFCAARAVRYLETPVSGTRSQALDATLKFYIGGAATDLDKVAPLIDAMGAERTHVGGHGAAASIKLVLNHMMSCSIAAFAEGAVLGQSLGLDRDMVFHILSASPATAPFLAWEVPKLKGEAHEIDFSLRLAGKDLALIAQAGQEAQAPLPLANVVKELFHLARRAGLGDKDYTAIYEYMALDRDGTSAP